VKCILVEIIRLVGLKISVGNPEKQEGGIKMHEYSEAVINEASEVAVPGGCSEQSICQVLLLRVLTPYRLVRRYQHFGETYCFHLQG
jgi:hypothetical protein